MVKKMVKKIDKQEAERRRCEGLTLTFTFPDAETMDAFCGYMSDGGGEYYAMDAIEEYTRRCPYFTYSRCFPAWGWKPHEPKHIDLISEE